MVHVSSLVVLIILYILILIIGIITAWKKTRKSNAAANQGAAETLIVANRDISSFVGFCTMTSVWGGGSYITGTSEIVFKSGLVSAQAPAAYSLSMILGGIFFAKPMREKRYVTMLDPFQQKYGKLVGGLMFTPALIAQIFWCAAILSSLGASVSVIVELDFRISIIVSGSVVVLYTIFGGQYSVCYSDVAQLMLIVFGLLLCTPFIWNSRHVSWNNKDISMILNVSDKNVTTKSHDWIGTLDRQDIPRYVDEYLLLIFGGIPWQDYFQRVLSAKSTQDAQMLSILGGLSCFFLSFPSVIIGYVARNVDWDEAGYGYKNVEANAQVVLPLVLQYLTPEAVACFGLGSLAAGIMSSTDASVLAPSSMFTHNIYSTIFRPKASEREILWILRIGFIVAGAVSAALAIVDQSVYALCVFSSDFVYVILFPQLVCVLFCNFVNSYGVIAGSLISIVLRILGGEETLDISPILKYPYFDYSSNKQLFPYKTFAMICNFIITWLISLISAAVIEKLSKLDNCACKSAAAIHPIEYEFETTKL